MKESFTIIETFKVSPSEIYNAWLNSELHGDMIGGEAQCTNVVGDEFSAWDGYITGKNLELIENKKIVQTWRTTEFDDEDEDSILTVEFVELENGGAELKLTHTNIPEGQTQYEQGWKDHYFTPMKDFFK